MLRGLVLLMLAVNAAIFAWIRSDPGWTQADREPQRLQSQVAPETIEWLPDTPASGARRPPTAAPGPGTGGAASAASPAALPSAAGPERAQAVPTVASALACLESAPLAPPEWSRLERSLAEAGIPAEAMSPREAVLPTHWLVYMGRFAEEAQWQRKADELRRLKLAFERIASPPALAPGLGLGHYPSEAAADQRLADLTARGVRTARVLKIDATPARRLRLQLDDAQQRRLPAPERFHACPKPTA